MQTLDLKCKQCGKVYQWVQNPMDKPACPDCGHHKAILIK